MIFSLLAMFSFLLLSPILSSLFSSPSLALDSFYPPLDLSFIANTSGTYGGIYSAPSDTASPDNGSVYNYCSMPHARPATYAPPAPVANGSVSAELVYVEYMQRHQRRTPYNIVPGDKPFHCDSIHPHLFAAPADGTFHPAPVYAQSYSDPSNPFLSTYTPGTCQYPQLTLGGLLDGYQVGQDLRSIYGDRLGLIPKSPDNSTHRVWLRSSTSALTQDTAGGVLGGLFPSHTAGIALHQQPSGIDTVDKGFPCAARDNLLNTIQSTPEWNDHLDVTKNLRDTLSSMLGVDSSWTATFDHFADNFQARQCNGYALPCDPKNASSCVTQEQADAVFRAGDWEWNYWWRTNKNATEYIQLTEGLFIAEILGRLGKVQEKTGEIVYSHTFIHDGDVGPILGALGIKALRWPGMGSNIAIEVWRTEEKDFARVLYSGRVLETVHGVMEWVELGRLMGVLREFVPGDIVKMCSR